MSGQILDIRQRHTLFQQIRDRGDSKRMGRKSSRKPGIPQPSLHHATHVIGRHGILSEFPRLADRGPKQRSVELAYWMPLCSR